eukprot:g8661.t1
MCPAEIAPLLPPTQSVSEIYTVDEALAHIGFGRFQIVLLFVLGMSWFADATEILVLSFLGPDVKCEWDLSGAAMSIIGTVVFVGMGIGAYIWSCISNIFGRKPASILSVGVIVVAGTLSAFAPNYWTLVSLRTIAGIGLGGSTPIYTMYSEFLPVDRRGAILCLYQMLWAFGSILAAGMAWLIMPTFGWHGLLLIAVLPALVLLSMLPMVPESPRYLVVMGMEQQATDVLSYIAKVNKSSIPPGQLGKVIKEKESISKWRKFKKQFHSLFEYPLTYLTPLLWLMFFAAGLSYFAIAILATSIHTKDNKDNDSCDGDHVDLSSKDYLDVLYNSMSEAPAYILGAISIGYLGRLGALKIGWWSAAFFVILMRILEQHATLILIFARLAVSYLFMAAYAFSLEIYPSSCRPFGMGMLHIISRVGAGLSTFVAQAFYNAYGLTIVTVILGVILVIAGLAVFLFPFDTTGGSMMDSTEEITRAIRNNQNSSSVP